MNVRASLRSVVRSTRSRRAIEADVDDEFAHHLEQLQRELARPGVSADDAAALAAERFGDADALRRVCVEIQLEDRAMLMRLNAILTAALLVGVCALGWLVVRNAREQARTLDAIAAKIGGPSAVSVVRTRDGLVAADPKPAFVYVSGKIGRAGVYSMEKAGMTLDRLLVAAGGALPEAKRITVKRGEGAKQVTVAELTPAELTTTACATVLAPDDLVSVE